MSQPDRDEPRRFRLGRDLQTGGLIAYQLAGPRLQAEDIIEVVESREPFPSDVKAAARVFCRLFGYALGWGTNRFDSLDEGLQGVVLRDVRAVLNAVSSHRDEDEDSAGAECSRLEDDMLEIHDALVDAGLPGTINAQNIIERINALASHRDDEARER